MPGLREVRMNLYIPTGVSGNREPVGDGPFCRGVPIPVLCTRGPNLDP